MGWTVTKRKNKTKSISPALQRILRNPFSVTEEDIRKGYPKIVFRFAFKREVLLAFPRPRSSGKRLLEMVSGTRFLWSEKGYYFPLPELREFLLKLRDKNVSFAVEETASLRLKEGAEIRSKIKDQETFLQSESELQQSLLFPYLVVVQGTSSLRLVCPLAEVLKLLFPRVQKGAGPELTLSEEQAYTVLGQSIKNHFPLWITEETALRLLPERTPLTQPRYGIGEGECLASGALLSWMWGPEGPLCVIRSSRRDELNTLLEQLVAYGMTLKMRHPAGLIVLSTPLRTLQRVFTETSELVEGSVATTVQFETMKREVSRRALQIERRDAFLAMKDVVLELQNAELEQKLYPHQRLAVRWMLESPFAFLGDDMGLGKTLSVLTYADELLSRDQIDLLLVVCPNSLVRNWKREATQWLPERQVAFLAGDKAERQEFMATLKSHKELPFKILVLNYEAARLDYVAPELEALAQRKRVLLCVDESQRVKNPQTKSFEALLSIAEAASRRVLLSGTPVPKEFADIWGQMRILDGGERFGKSYLRWLTSIAELGTRYSEIAVRRYRPDKVKDATLRVHELLLRRTKEEVIDLPPKQFVVRDVELTGDQEQRYDEVREELFVRMTTLRGKEFTRAIQSVLEQTVRAVQIASNPRLVDPKWKGEPAKFVELDAIVDEVVKERGEKLVIWTNFLKNIDELILRYKAYHAAPFSGEVSAEERAKTVEAFQSSDPKSPSILIAVPAAGGVGITLTAAKTAVYLDKTWNAEHWLQSIDRVHRIGQKGTVSIISLHACGLDELIAANVRKKEKNQNKFFAGENYELTGVLPTREELLEHIKVR